MKKEYAAIVIVIIILSGILISKRMLPQNLEDILGEEVATVSKWEMFHPDFGQAQLDLEQSVKLIDVCSEAKYYDEGKYSNVIEGTLYHIDGKTESGSFISFMISEKGYLLIEGKQYRISPAEKILEELECNFTKQ